MVAIAIYPVPIKKAVKLLNDFSKQKFKCVMPYEVENALLFLDSQDRCFTCGKKLKKVGEYEWRCFCFPKNLRMSKG